MELRTDESSLGKFRQGEIVVVEKRSDQAFTGTYATRKIRTQIPSGSPSTCPRFERSPDEASRLQRRRVSCRGFCDDPKEILRS